MNDRNTLQNLLQQLAEQLPQQAGPQVETRLRAAIRARAQARRHVRNRWWSLAALACLLLVTSWLWLHRVQPESASLLNDGFIALPYAQNDIPMETTVIVRVTLKPADLESLGFTTSSPAPVRADLLVAQDGIPRAVRIAR